VLIANRGIMVLLVGGFVFGSLAGLAARRGKPRMFLVGVIGVIAVIVLEGLLSTFHGGIDLGMLGMWVGVTAVLVIYAAWVFTSFRRGLGVFELQRCLSFSTRAYITVSVVLPLAVSMFIVGILALIMLAERGSQLTTAKLYALAAASTALTVLGFYSTYHTVNRLRSLCAREA